MSLLLIAAGFTALGGVLATILFLVAWLDRPGADDEASTWRRLIDGAVLGTLLVLAAGLGAGAACFATWFLVVLGGGSPLLPRSAVAGAACVGAVAAAAGFGAARLPPARRGALRGVTVLAFAAVAGMGTLLSPVPVVGPSVDAVALVTAVAAASLGSAALLAPPRAGAPDGE